MRLLALITCVGVLAVSAFGTDKVVPITDTLPNRSPVRNSGRVIFSEEASGDRVITSYSQDWTVKNDSSKAIVTVIESLTLQFPGGYQSGGVERYELFFVPSTMKPGDELSFAHPAESVQQVRKSNAISGEPTCEVRVLWIQFADGSTFGDEKYAISLKSDRRQILEGLVRLRDLYASKGSEAFLNEIRPDGPLGSSAFDVYLDQLRASYKQTGNIQSCYDKLQGWLEIAQSRQGLLD
jgi:hypothetical protein